MLAVVGCGNPLRSDDGVGSVVIRQLKESSVVIKTTNVKLFDAGTDGMAVMFQAKGSDSLVVVDASRTGAKPGSVFEVPADHLVTQHQPSLNLHDFRWDHAIYAGRKIFADSFPKSVKVYLIEGASFEMGIGLTPDVDKAAQWVVDKILDGDDYF